VIALFASYSIAVSFPLSAQEKVGLTLDVASTFPSHMPLLGDTARDLSERVSRISGGEITLKFHEPGVLIPAAETVKGVAKGSVQAAWAGAGWFADIDSAFNMFSAVPFGPGVGEYMAWLYYGGGLDMAREMFHRHGVHNIPCTIIPPEASGWFRKEIRSTEDLKGLRMRMFGFGAKVLGKFGVETVQLAPGDILQAMKTDKLDAAEFSLPSMDQQLKLQSAATYYYFPGWHQQATFFDLYINATVWSTMAERHRALIEIACGETMRDTIARGEALQWKAMKEMQAEGVKLRRWPAEVLVALEEAWHAVIAEETERNPNFKRVYGSYAAFRDNYSIWRHFSYLQ
jgi:TRAP-type mannitol/chloroaromatic compound transport system substrate-binding protein